MKPEEIYKWEIETKDKKIYTTKSNKIKPSDVVRISFIPQISILPRHDITLDGYIRRFGRCSFRLDNTMKEYLHCVVFQRFRFYLRSSNGQCIITPYDYELYI